MLGKCVKGLDKREYVGVLTNTNIKSVKKPAK